MKIKHLFTYCLLASTFLLASCDNETLPDGDGAGIPLPEGMYPLTFTATQDDGGGVQTRVSEKTDGNSQWSDGDVIGVRIGTDTRTGSYTLNVNGTIKSTNTPLYWQNSETQVVTGWYPANGDGLRDKLLNQQTNGFPYVLKGTGSGAYNSSASLSFTHQLAKVRIKLTGTAKGLENAKVTLKGYTDFTYTEGTISGAKTEGTITPKNKNTDGYYEALLIPIGANSVPDKFVTIKVGDNTFYYTPTGETAKLVTGHVYTYTITVNEPPLTPAKPITISDDGKYIITGSGDQTITISGGSPKVTLNNVTMGNNINITGGTPTLIIKGNTTLNKNGLIQISGENTNVTIEGDGTLNALAIRSGQYKTCGNITIKGITANISNNIGGGDCGNCGNIKIENAKITIANGEGAAAIGCGIPYSADVITKCGNIEIINSDITAYAGNNFAAGPAVIGCCGAYNNATKGNCGNITITLQQNQPKDSFLSKLTLYNTSAEKVGLGACSNNLAGKVGTIIWKQADGTVIETISARDVDL